MSAGDAGVNTQAGTVGIGYKSLQALTSGAGNLAIGYEALSTATDAIGVVAIGYHAFKDLTSSGNTDSVAIGYLAGAESLSVDGAVYIGGQWH